MKNAVTHSPAAEQGRMTLMDDIKKVVDMHMVDVRVCGARMVTVGGFAPDKAIVRIDCCDDHKHATSRSQDAPCGSEL